MREDAECIQVFTPEMIDTMARIWTRASISLMDVRHQLIRPGQPLQNYRMPSSMLVYAYGGSANVQLNQTLFGMERFGVFHGGKGTTLSISPEGETLGSFMVLYKAEAPPFFRRDLQRLLEQVNPFVQLYGLVPGNPVGLVNIYQQMLESWNQATAMNHLFAKNLFYQSIHEIYRDLERSEARFLQPDPALSAKRYLDKHYMRPIMFQELADLFSISSGQLTRLFKKREGKSLQEYAIQKRLEDARRHLKYTNATVKEIAIGCGFADEVNFFRMFKKHFRMTPIDYRKISTLSMQECIIDNGSQRIYNEIGLAGLVKSQRDGELTMFGQKRSKQMLLATAMSLMLLLSACASNMPANNGAASNTAPAQTQQGQSTPGIETKETESTSSQTRIVHTVKGEVEIPSNPRRIIADTYMGSLIALGIAPIGTPTKFLKNPFYPELLKSVEDIGEQKSISFEKVVELQPDVIITGDEKAYESYQKIAPTILIPYGELKTDQEEISYLGEVLGLEAEAAAWMTDYETRRSSMKKRVESAVGANATFSIIEDWGEKSVAVFGDNFGRGGQAVYRLLQLKPPAEREAEIMEQQMLQLSWETLADYVGDYIVLTSDRLTLQDLQADPIWSSLDAVKNDRVYIWSSIHGWYFDPLSTLAQAEELTNWLTSK
ncbi:hypothetical protein B1A99_26700 [Cohnella sp. CIP 111063]|uniref:AraC family transcriptional regulator n=1 Tax=unclassified Cohnella TaxID=2636738 RepID=UPI000B8C6579|nr:MULTISPECIES: AraC family transcriptional regulator [unclassified Cohnella]OXS54537.1 hypothetical protein B1A99_26700 [Cohnella sp. CIP 111063]PRX64045.1 iron complex transport system substrate-binding protein [Cohnella sp. SGD-V74]